MSGINIVRNLQILYFSKKNKEIKNLKNDEKFVTRYPHLYILLPLLFWLPVYLIYEMEKLSFFMPISHKWDLIQTILVHVEDFNSIKLTKKGINFVFNWFLIDALLSLLMVQVDMWVYQCV